MKLISAKSSSYNTLDVIEPNELLFYVLLINCDAIRQLNRKLFLSGP